jgi:hypothetical protein
MAKGKNAEFKRNPCLFLQNHTLMVSPDAYTPQTKLASGLTKIDLVMTDASITPKVVRLESYDARSHGVGAKAIDAYYLPAVVDDANTIEIGDKADYMFTADLSGCLFAAYGKDGKQLTVEHVNARTSKAKVPLARRANEINNAGHAYCKIIAPAKLPDAQVESYDTGGNVIGIRENGAWKFYHHLDQRKVGEL